jgi:hypothetical protein
MRGDVLVVDAGQAHGGPDKSGPPGLLRALSLDSPVASDFTLFESIALKGDIYSRIIADCTTAGVALPDAPEAARDRVKVLLMRDVLAKKKPYPSPFEDVFQQTFPSVHRFVQWINRENHAELIRTLQRLESWLVVENVAPRLVGRFPIVTLHNAIYARIEDLPAVVDGFDETFAELGLPLKVKVESTPIGAATGAPARTVALEEKKRRPLWHRCRYCAIKHNMNNNAKQPVSDLLRRTIAESGVPYLILERETGVVRTSIMRFVEGRQYLRLDAVDRLAEHFGLELVKKRKAK